MMSGEVSSARSTADRLSSASPTTSKSDSRLEDVADADAEQRVVVDDEDLRPLTRRRPPIRSAPPAFRSRITHQAGLLCSQRDRQPNERATVGPRLHLEAGADQFCALSHELEAEVPAATGGDRSDVEPSAVVPDRQHPVVAVDRAGDDDR